VGSITGSAAAGGAAAGGSPSAAAAAAGTDAAGGSPFQTASGIQSACLSARRTADCQPNGVRHYEFIA